jgi:hypothetical protein
LQHNTYIHLCQRMTPPPCLNDARPRV